MIKKRAIPRETGQGSGSVFGTCDLLCLTIALDASDHCWGGPDGYPAPQDWCSLHPSTEQAAQLAKYHQEWSLGPLSILLGTPLSPQSYSLKHVFSGPACTCADTPTLPLLFLSVEHNQPDSDISHFFIISVSPPCPLGYELCFVPQVRSAPSSGFWWIAVG